METSKTHVFRVDPYVTKNVTCICGQPFTSPIHVTEIKRVAYGVARPNYVGRQK